MDTVISEIFVTIECGFLTIVLFWLYHSKKINAVELIFYAFGCSTFFVAFISDTITPMFFVTTFFFISEAITLFRSGMKVKLSLLIIIFLPLLSSLTVAFLIFAGFDIFDGYNPSVFRIFFDGCFFYLKYFFPFIFLGVRIYREARVHDAEYFFSIMKRVAIISCYIGLCQLVLSMLISNEIILRVVGLRPNYVSFTASGREADHARISAFFVEPKAFASYLVVTFPLFLRQKKLIPIMLVLVVGLLTGSQTFVVGIIVAVIVFFIIRRVKNIRLNIALGLTIVIAAFLSIAALKQVLYDFYMAHSDNYVVNLVLARAIDRYDINDESSVTTSFLGMPLEKDTELPVSLFFATKPLLYLSGYGPKNGGFVSPDYYIFNEPGFKKVGSMSYSLDLRWYFFVSEFGIIIFFVWLTYFTRRFDSSVIPFFENKYYAFLFVFLFFNAIELIIIMIYALYMGTCYYRKNAATLQTTS